MSKGFIKDSTLTDIANAIREKTGESGGILPSEMAEKISNIPTGGDDNLYPTKVILNGIDLSNKNSISFPNACVTMMNLTLPETFELICDSLDTTRYQAFYEISNIKTLKFNGKISLSGSTGSSMRLFDGCRSLITIDADLDFSLITSVTQFFQGTGNIVNVRFLKNSIKCNFAFANGSTMSDDSLISFANGLSDENAYTVTFTATQKTNVNNIIGENISGEFVKNSEGTLSLSDFITNVKGWTIA